MRLRNSGARGFTLVEIMIVATIFGIVIAIAAPGFIRARTHSRVRACQENLAKLSGAIQQWAVENNKKAEDTPTYPDDLINSEKNGHKYLKREPFCPSADGEPYVIKAVQDPPTCPVVTDLPLHDLDFIQSVITSSE